VSGGWLILGAEGGLPLDDWQFWVATALFVFAAGWLLRGVVPIPILSKRHHRRKTERRATLTVGGQPVRRQK
jgi:hypothetical protein